jgi:hypothetical protein
LYQPAILGRAARAHVMKIVTLAFSMLVALVACDDGEQLFPNSPSPTTSTEFPTTPPLGSPTPPALPQRPPPTAGEASASCVDGWTTPDPDSTLARRALRTIRRATRLRGDPVVVDMRYFTGPESPPSEKGYILTIERWYVKLYAEDDFAFQGRFLVESREFGSGVVAVAPYDTRGFRSPDWSGFAWNEADPQRRSYPSLPGAWAGIRYDFVRGGAGLTIRGLPPDVVGCLAGT